MTPTVASIVAEVVETGPVRWPGAPPGWALVVLLAALAMGVRWIYRRERQKVSRPVRVVLGGLRILAVVLVAAVLFRPEREEVRKAEDKGHLAILVDTSTSMTTQDRYRAEDEARVLAAAWPEGGPQERPSSLSLARSEIVSRVLAGAGEPVLRALAERFVLHAYAFDEDLRSLATTEVRGEEPGSGPAADRVAALAKAIRQEPVAGTRTDLGAALKGVAREFAGRDDRRLAGVVLLSDGRDNSAGERPGEALASLGRGAEDLRVHAVGLGDPRLARNLRVDRVNAKDVVLVQDQVTFAADLGQTGFDGATGVEVTLEVWQVAAADGTPLPQPRRYDPPTGVEGLRAVVTLNAAPRPTPVALRAFFKEAGTFDVRVKAALPPSLAQEDAVLEDDARVHRLRVVDATIRVLVADGTMRYETHFLKNVLVRESRRDGSPRRVDAQVWIQSFDRDVRQPSGRSVPALRAFPSTRQEIFSYDVIVLGDVNWRLLADTEERAREVLKLLVDFVEEGGGIAFVAGEDENPTQYLDTPLAALLPVVARSSDRAGEPDHSMAFRILPTEAGQSHPILLSVAPESPERAARAWREREGWDWYWLYRAKGGLKPGAWALARVAGVTSPAFQDERGEPLVAFAAMEYGKGRVFFSALDQISRIRRGVGDAYYAPFWDETIRWLATYRLLGGNKRYKIETDKESYFVGESAVVKVTALDANFEPLREPVLRGLQVDDPKGRPLLAEGDAARLDPESGLGVYRAAVRLSQSGSYRAWVEPPTRDGGARAERSFEVRFATTEDRDKVADHETLRAIVRATNPPGSASRVFAPWELADLVRALPDRTTERILNREEVTLWDGPWPLILVTLVLAAEWVLRKRFQMI